MIKQHIALFFIVFLFCFDICFAQSPVGVDPLTGAANVVIPIYTLRSGQVSLPVSLSYSGSGVKPKDVEGTAGMNWQLNAGGQVSRVVRGLPDDCTADVAGNSMFGWMSSSDTAPAAISGFTIANNGSTCSNETSDISYITSHFSYTMDAEPDQFYVSAPGLSCQLIFDRVSGTFKPVNYQDLVINYTTDPTTHLIVSFTITNDKGITYSFGNDSDLVPACELVTQGTSGGSQVYFSTKCQQYQHGINYYDSWGLMSINDANGNGIQLNYAPSSPKRSSTDSVALYIGGSTSSSAQYYVHQSITPYTLQGIQTYNAYAYSPIALTFTWTTFSGSGQTGETAIASIAGMGRDFQFQYSPVVYTSSGYTRNFLRNFSDPGCSTPINYTFAYNGETNTGTVLNPRYTTILPDSASNNTDYWGYYTTTMGATTSRVPSVFINPSTSSYPRYLISASNTYNPAYAYYFSNTNRMADPVNVIAGALNKISYVQGGNTNILYESNDYYDVPAGVTVKGGGIRVKQLIDSVGNGSANNIVRNYTYVNPATGFSSGKPVSLPQYAFTIPYSGSATGVSLWGLATALSAHDLSTEDHTIMYAYSKVSQTGAGYTVSQFYVPATNWDASAAPDCSNCGTEWSPTTNYMGRANCTSSYGPISNYTYSYPFIPNPNYDFERGLPVKVSSYTDNGFEVAESDYTYARSYGPTAVSAFKYDVNPGSTLTAYGYNKYTLYYNTSELTTKVVRKLYDSVYSQLHTDSVLYTYGSANHKLLTAQQATNSDGSVLATHIFYSKDYTAAAGTNANVTAIYNLQQQHINVPVESYQQVTRAGNTTTTTAALTLFRDTTIASVVHVVPSQQFKWIQPSGAAFSSMSITGQTLTKDANYFDAVNYDIYDNTGYPQTVDDNNKHIQTTIINHFANQPIAAFSNAAFNQVAYSDFDSDLASPAYGFTIGGTGSYTPVGSHAGNAAGLAATTQYATSGTLTKNALAKNYIFSIWINPSAPGTLTIAITGVSPSPTITYSAGWKYYEVPVAASSISAAFTVSITASTNVSIDDILVYPDVSEATTATYDPVTRHKLDATNTNGVSAYYTIDQWGRLLYAFDQDKNIVQKNTYLTPADVGTYNTMIIGASGAITNGQPAGFSIYGPDACAAAGTTVTWNFGDGTQVTSAGLVSPSHTYNTIGPETVTATVSSTLFGTKPPISLNVTVLPASIPLSYASRTTGGGNVTAVTFTTVGTSTPAYTFTGTQLNSVSVAQGNYIIKVSLIGGTQYNATTGTGYSSVSLTGSSYSACQNWATGNNYTFNANLSNCTSLNIAISQLVCSVEPQ